MEKLVELIKLFGKETWEPLEYFNTYTHYWNNVDLTSKYSISQFLRKRNYNWFLNWLDKNGFIDYKKVDEKFWNCWMTWNTFVENWVEYYYTNEFHDEWINLLISLLK